ncbi:MAG: radical SAM protein, partial [Candidatus Omnitrophica bacterium]|nr:radical SAM protein [Candidatus Omnitrophota bacterium]
MKVALLQCPGWGRDCPPYTLALLSAWLRNNGHQAFTFDLNNALYCSGPDKYKRMWDDKDLYSFWSNESLIGEFLQENERMMDFQIGKILDTDAKIVGFTVHFTSLLVSLAIARKIKAKAPDKIVVFGGPDCYRDMKGTAIINQEAVDIVVTGEGELTLLELVEIVEKSGKVDFCKGTFLKKDGQVIDCGDRPVINDLDSTPFADYSDFSDDIALGHYREPERLEILDSRGCVTCCHFCSEWQFWKSFRSMSGERIFEEITFQMRKNPGVNYFYFIGSLLNGDPGALWRFCNLVIENNLKLRWSGQAVVRPEMTQGLLEDMRRAGCEWLGIGIESGSQRVRDKVNKHFTNKNAEEMLRYAHQAGITTQVNFMFGIPSETENDFQESLEFLKRNRENIDSVLASQSFCVIDKGTYLHTHAKELGIKNAHHHLYWETKDNNYLVMQRRYEEFCRLALSLGLPETSGVLRVKPDKWLLSGDYHNFKKDYAPAVESYKNSFMTESANDGLLQKIELCRGELEKNRIFGSGVVPSEIQSCGTGIDTEALEANLGESQKSIARVLRRLNLNTKVENLILIEKQKEDRHEYVAGYPYWLTIDPNNSCPLKCP